MTEQKRAPWYRATVQTPQGVIEVTLSDEDEARMMGWVLRSGTPFQIWAQRHSGAVEMMQIIPASGVRTSVRPAQAIALNAQGQPCGPNEVPTAAIQPADPRYNQFALPARLIAGPEWVPASGDVAADIGQIRELLTRAAAMYAASPFAAQAGATATTPPTEAS